jgi:HAE1 family hydrophobic/amphiphilic exporter-1
MLIGLVKKNAIMMIDFALDAERNSGKTTMEAIYHGALVRFRPIMMTTMSALMGTLPIAVGFGTGAESRRPLGLCVVGGLVFSQLITLYITPVYYTYLDSFQKWLQRLFRRKVETGEEELRTSAAAFANPNGNSMAVTTDREER